MIAPLKQCFAGTALVTLVAFGIYPAGRPVHNFLHPSLYSATNAATRSALLLAGTPSFRQPTIDQFIGTNGFIDDPTDKLALPVGWVREYHDWLWDNEGKDGLLRYQPSGAAGGKSWFFDDFYAKLKALGVTVCPCVQQNSPTLFPGEPRTSRPVAKGANPEDPASYAVHARALFQFAARYGSTRVSSAQLTLAPDQPVRSGMGLLDYIENWNEPNGTWNGPASHFSPAELAAMCSADYDGDQGRLGKGAGVRTADKHMQLVMGGLSGLDLDYLKGMKQWADLHRGGDFPADVLNLHHYSDDQGSDNGFKTMGVSPEADHLRSKLAAIVAWRNANVPKCQLWLTEFGYDTNSGSPIHAPALGSYPAEVVQANWLVRSYLALAAAGVDRAAMFVFRDDNNAGNGVFESCGMVTEKGVWKPKPSYWYTATLKYSLRDMRFKAAVPCANSNVRVYRFASDAGHDAYVVWCATSTDLRVPGVVIKVGSLRAVRVDFVVGSAVGVAAPLVVTNGEVTVEAREQPVIIMAG